MKNIKQMTNTEWTEHLKGRNDDVCVGEKFREGGRRDGEREKEGTEGRREWKRKRERETEIERERERVREGGRAAGGAFTYKQKKALKGTSAGPSTCLRGRECGLEESTQWIRTRGCLEEVDQLCGYRAWELDNRVGVLTESRREIEIDRGWKKCLGSLKS